jgi:hypothetical protein
VCYFVTFWHYPVVEQTLYGVHPSAKNLPAIVASSSRPSRVCVCIIQRMGVSAGAHTVAPCISDFGCRLYACWVPGVEMVFSCI